MSRRKSLLPKYSKHKQSGQARVIINGRDYLLGRYGSKASEIEYERLISEFLASGRSPTFGLPDTKDNAVTMTMLMVEYLTHCINYFGDDDASETRRIRPILRKLRELYPDLPAAEFGPKNLKALRQRMIDRDDNARSYIKACIKRVVAMFKWAVEEEMIPESVYRTLKVVSSLKYGRTEARETNPVPTVPIADVEATILQLSPTLAAMISIQMLTGARPGEICKLTRGMVDPSGEVWTATLPEHKTQRHGKSRVLYFGPEAQSVLRPFLLRGSDDHIFRPCDAIKQRRERDPVPPSFLSYFWSYFLRCGESRGFVDHVANLVALRYC